MVILGYGQATLETIGRGPQIPSPKRQASNKFEIISTKQDDANGIEVTGVRYQESGVGEQLTAYN